MHIFSKHWKPNRLLSKRTKFDETEKLPGITELGQYLKAITFISGWDCFPCVQKISQSCQIITKFLQNSKFNGLRHCPRISGPGISKISSQSLMFLNHFLSGLNPWIFSESQNWSHLDRECIPHRYACWWFNRFTEGSTNFKVTNQLVKHGFESSCVLTWYFQSSEYFNQRFSWYSIKATNNVNHDTTEFFIGVDRRFNIIQSCSLLRFLQSSRSHPASDRDMVLEPWICLRLTLHRAARGCTVRQKRLVGGLAHTRYLADCLGQSGDGSPVLESIVHLNRNQDFEDRKSFKQASNVGGRLKNSPKFLGAASVARSEDGSTSVCWQDQGRLAPCRLCGQFLFLAGHFEDSGSFK